LDVLTTSDNELRGCIEESVRAGEDLANDISAAVMALQFQDRVSQQMGLVIEALEEIRQTLATCVSEQSNSDPVTTDGPQSDWADRLMGKCVMPSQRKVVQTHMNTTLQAADEFDDGVELF